MPTRVPMLHLRVPASVWLATALFAVLLAIAAYNVRGVVDAEGYPLNTNQFMAANTYDDDGAIIVYLSLDYAPDFATWSKWALNIGTPFILSARPLLRLADWLGIVTRFDDPSLYLLYPEKLRGVWQFLNLYKVLLVCWAPVVLYLVGRNVFSERTGLIAAWFMAVMPFPLGFEPRGKLDLLTILLGLLSLLCQAAYLRDRQTRQLVAAGAFLGVSLALKVIMIPALATLVIAFYWGRDKDRRPGLGGQAPLALAGLVCALVYLTANPSFLPALSSTVRLYSANLVDVQAGQNKSGLAAIVAAQLYRFVHFDSLLGTWLPGLLPLGLLAALWRVVRRGEQWRPVGLLVLFVAGDVLFLALIMRERMEFLTYYYYALAICGLLFAAFCGDRLMALGRRWRLGPVALALVVLVAAATFREQLAVFKYLIRPTDRQQAQAWITRHVPAGASIGIPLSPGTEYFNQRIRLDPFRYDLAFIGPQAQHLAQAGPDYALWQQSAPDVPLPPTPGYALAAAFARGLNLPHERCDLYQEEAFYLLRAANPRESREPRTFEAALGDFFRAAPSPDCNLLQYQSLYFYPLSLNLLRKTGDTLLPFASEAFFTTVRTAESPLAYVHGIDPALLNLWGVGYVLARVDDAGGFAANTLASGSYGLRELWRRDRTMQDGSTRPVGLFACDRSLGQGVFAPDAAPDAVFSAQGRAGVFGLGARPLKPYGAFFSRERFAELGVDTIEVVMDLTTDGQADIILKGGARRQSLLVGPGRHRIRTAYTVGRAVDNVGYEINPAGGQKTDIRVQALWAAPLALAGKPMVACPSLGPHQGFFRVHADRPGRLLVPMPYHQRWEASVDGRAVSVLPGIAGALAVPVPAGEHFVALFAR